MDDVDDPVDRWLDAARDLLGGGDDSDQLAAAARAVDEALSRAPTRADAWIVRCQIAAARGDDLGALAAAEAAVAHAPTASLSHYWRGALLGDLGHNVAALAAIERAFLHLGPDDDWLLEDLYFEKATLYDALGDREAAAATYRAGLARCPGSTLLRVGAEPLAPRSRAPALKLLRGGLG